MADFVDLQELTKKELVEWNVDVCDFIENLPFPITLLDDEGRV